MTSDIFDTCKNDNIDEYLLPENITNTIPKNAFNLFSLNVRSLSAHFDELTNLFSTEAQSIFSAIAFQEIWSIGRKMSLSGYHPLIFNTRDTNSTLNPGCGGGVGFFVKSCLQYEILEEENSFIPGVYESLWIAVKPNSKKKCHSYSFRKYL